MTKFSKDYQPEKRGHRPKKPDKKITMSVVVKPTTKDYLKSHNVKGGEVLDEYADNQVG